MKNRNQEALLLLLGGIVLTVIAIGQERRQEWTLKPSNTAGEYHFRLEMIKPHNHWSNSTDVPAGRFRGLPQDPFRQSGAAQFEYVQDAGRLLCKGRFSWSKGSGTFTFVPDPKFPAELEKLGYRAPDSDQVFQMMLADLSLEFARAVKDAGVHATTAQLLDLRHHGVDVAYIAGIRKSGYDRLTADEYINLRNHGVTTTFVAGLKDAGYDASVDQIVELRNHGVSSRYLAELKAYGLKPHVREIVQLRNHGVTPDYLRSLRDAGYDNLSADEITGLKNHGVPAEFAQEAKELGYSFSPKELIDMRNHGVNGAYLRRLRDSGMKNLTASQISKLKSHGVD
jgi:hypothetical protein